VLQAALASYRNSASKPARYADAYERVFIEAARGNHDIFTTSAEIMSTWRIIEHILQEWSKDGAGLRHYAKGSAEVPTK
jgi:glucose-6-phosphate 1-dehydrogenase